MAAHRNLGLCLLRMGEARAAIGYLKSASELGQGLDFEVENLLAVAESNPAKAIDRTVDSSTLKDSERPMWEAFEGNQPAAPVTRVLGR